MSSDPVEYVIKDKQSEPSDAAKAALERADANELFHHYMEALRKCDKMGDALSSVATHFIDRPNTPRYLPSENSIEAMERVALAAIDLAKAVAARNGAPVL